MCASWRDSCASQLDTEYRALNPAGKAVIKVTEYLPSHESPTDEFPAL
jgi:hypothetical protein